MLNKKTIRDVDVAGKRVLMRVDFNVPIKDGVVGDDTRVRGALPSIEYLMEKGAALVLCSHLGRPKSPQDTQFSLRPVAEYLQTLVANKVHFVPELVGSAAKQASLDLKPGEILLLENTRFQPGETANDEALSRELASLADIYVNDAFGSAHRAHASTAGVAKFLPSCAGFLMEKEINYLGNAIANPARPFTAILGGAKISDKIGVIENLLRKADHVLIGGGMANTFFKAKGLDIADSLVEDEALDTAKKLLGSSKLHLPLDIVIADRFDQDAHRKVIAVGNVPAGWRILDIGPATVSAYSTHLDDAGTVVWNGPMGVFEFPRFATGTFGIAQAVAGSNAVSIIGGGDSVAAIQQSGLADKVTHISTGGGAALEMLEGIELPGLAALDDR